MHRFERRNKNENCVININSRFGLIRRLIPQRADKVLARSVNKSHVCFAIAENIIEDVVLSLQFESCFHTHYQSVWWFFFCSQSVVGFVAMQQEHVARGCAIGHVDKLAQGRVLSAPNVSHHQIAATAGPLAP